MSDKRPSKRLPFLHAYLESAAARGMNVDLVLVAVLVAGGLSIGPLIVLGLALKSLWFPLLAGVAILGLLGSVALGRWRNRPRPTEHQIRFRAALSKLLTSAQAKRLHRELDPAVATAVDAAAMQWSRVSNALDWPLWQEQTSGQTVAVLRDQARLAADQAMEEAVILAATCLGEPQRRKKDDLKEVLEDFVELDIADALRGLKRMASADATEYAHHSPHRAIVDGPLRSAAERLRSLADELEETLQRFVPSETEGTLPTAPSSIDLVLRELRAVREAEAELDAEQDLRN